MTSPVSHSSFASFAQLQASPHNVLGPQHSGNSNISKGAISPRPNPAAAAEAAADEDFAIMAKEAARREVHKVTFGYGLHSTALQIKDPMKSKWFYTNVLGMEVVKETEMHEITMIFLAFPNPIDREDPDLEFGQRRGLLQLVHVADSETDPTFKVRHAGPGFCHTCVSVPDLEQAMARMKSLGVDIVEEGSNDMGFGAIADPDGYSIQLLHCKIDQSLALKRQLEEMMTIASSSSSGRRHSVMTDAQRDSFSDGNTGQNFTNGSSMSSGALIHSFRGGSPNLEHPAWQGMQAPSAPATSPVKPPASPSPAPQKVTGEPLSNLSADPTSPTTSANRGTSPLQSPTALSPSSGAGRSKKQVPIFADLASLTGASSSSKSSKKSPTVTITRSVDQETQANPGFEAGSSPAASSKGFKSSNAATSHKKSRSASNGYVGASASAAGGIAEPSKSTNVTTTPSTLGFKSLRGRFGGGGGGGGGKINGHGSSGGGGNGVAGNPGR